MLKNTFTSIKPSFLLILKDRVSLLFSLVPIFIGSALYIILGREILARGMQYGNEFVSQYLSNETVGGFLSFIIASILSILLFFLVNWTFVLILSVIASPFNDLISSRIEKKLKGERSPSVKESIGQFFKKCIGVVFTEIKKVVVIILLSIISLFFSYIPFLTPFSVGITVLLLAIGFLDYSWSRNNFRFGECRKDVQKNFLSYLFGGGIFMIFVSIPFINIFVPPLATSYFTILWFKNNERRH